MKPTRYLSSKSIALCCIALGLTLWTVFAVLSGLPAAFTVITDCGVLTAVTAWLAIDYALTNRRLKKLERLCAEADGYLVGEILPRPANAFEEEYFSVMKTVSRSAVDRVEAAARERDEYCDYVEKWIHEIKTPLAACSLSIANGGNRAVLKSELKRAENLTETVLYHARLRSAEKSTKLSAFNVKSAIDEALQSETELLVSARIGVNADGDFTAVSDKSALVFMIKQLLVNCAKYCPACHIDITASGGKITIEDNGAGIPSHELPAVFNRGFVGEIGRKRGGGSGMGLYIVSELCKRLGIEITCESEEGRFTRFKLDLGQGNVSKM